MILPEELTEDVSAISGYLPEIRSQRALAEFCNNILTVQDHLDRFRNNRLVRRLKLRDQVFPRRSDPAVHIDDLVAALIGRQHVLNQPGHTARVSGAYDNMAEGFDREAVRIEFDAIRDLARYMLDTELSSENYANGLKILENLELLMDTPVDAGLSEKAGAWLAKFNAFQESFNIEYQNRPYAHGQNDTRSQLSSFIRFHIQPGVHSIQKRVRRVQETTDLRLDHDPPQHIIQRCFGSLYRSIQHVGRVQLTTFCQQIPNRFF